MLGQFDLADRHRVQAHLLTCNALRAVRPELEGNGAG